MEERGYDYAGHYPAMINRRLQSRCEAANTKNFTDYLAHLKENPAEVDTLIDALTITVSMFFRNPLTWEFIAHQVLPSLCYTKLAGNNREFRVWSAGCATGEEPYSMAILLSELQSREAAGFETTIFATDQEKKAIQFARKGIYDKASVKEVKLGILNKYFKQEEESYKLLPEIRQGVNFSQYDLLDPGNYAPPESVFGTFDLILCRNVLIYYQPEYQEKIFNKLYRSLSAGGYLVLGEAESLVGSYFNNFREINRLAKIFQKKPS